MYLIWSCGLQTHVQCGQSVNSCVSHVDTVINKKSNTWHYTHVWFTQLQYNSSSGKETNNHTYYIFTPSICLNSLKKQTPLQTKHESASVVELWFSVINQWEWGRWLIELIFYDTDHLWGCHVCWNLLSAKPTSWPSFEKWPHSSLIMPSTANKWQKV